MILYIIFAAIIIYKWLQSAHILFYDRTSWHGHFEDIVEMAPPALLLFFIGSFTIFLVSAIPSYTAKREYYPVSEKALIAFKDDEFYMKQFFYGESGKIKYSYIVEEQFGYQMKQINVESATIRYTNPGEKPYVQTLEGHMKNPILHWFFIDWGDVKTVFYIPEGSISIENTYVVDMGS